MLLIEYPKCSTCKKAKAFLKDNNISFMDRDIINETPTAEELRKWKEKFDIPIKKLFNTSGLKYKELNLKDKLSTMTEDEQYLLLSSDGMLIKRPLLVGNNFMLMGFKEKEWIKLEEIK